MQTIYRTTCWGQVWQLRADWAQAADTIYVLDDDGAWMPAGIGRVADYRHSPRAAMRRYLELIAQDGGDTDPSAIRAALARADAARQLGRTRSPQKASSSRQNGRRGGCQPGEGGRPARLPFVVGRRRYARHEDTVTPAGADWSSYDLVAQDAPTICYMPANYRRRQILAAFAQMGVPTGAE